MILFQRFAADLALQTHVGDISSGLSAGLREIEVKVSEE